MGIGTAKKRTLSRETTSFNAYVDQNNAIEKIAAQTHQKSVHVIRMLLDEGLKAFRSKHLGSENSAGEITIESLHEGISTVTRIMLKLVDEQRQARNQIQADYQLNQEAFVETLAMRQSVNKVLIKPALENQGTSEETFREQLKALRETTITTVKKKVSEIERGIHDDDADDEARVPQVTGDNEALIN